MAININLLLIVISGLILFRGSIFKIKFYKLKAFYFNNIFDNWYIIAPVAQLDRALGYGPGGSGFKS